MVPNVQFTLLKVLTGLKMLLESLAEDKSANVESHLLLKPGLLRHNGNVTSLPIVDEDKTQTFACHVVHRNLPNPKYNTRQVDVNLLCKAMVHFFGATQIFND